MSTALRAETLSCHNMTELAAAYLDANRHIRELTFTSVATQQACGPPPSAVSAFPAGLGRANMCVLPPDEDPKPVPQPTQPFFQFLESTRSKERGVSL